MQIHEIRVTSVSGDPLGNEVAEEAIHTLEMDGLHAVRTAKVYRLEGISEAEAHFLARELLTDPVNEQYYLGSSADFETDKVVEVAYKPGVMNPEAASIMKGAWDLGIHPQAADSSREFAFFGSISPDQVDSVVGQLLVNKTVQHVVNEKPDTLLFKGNTGPIRIVPVRDASEKELLDLSKDKLFLSGSEMAIVQHYFRRIDREPRDGELEAIAARWSEHCGHKTFNAKVLVKQEDGSIQEKLALYDRIKASSRAHPNYDRLVISAFKDNSGVMRFYDGQAICGKVETHNSPSALEPYGGAMTGSGGVFRDVMGTGQGAKTIISTDMFCFAPPDLDSAVLPQGTLRPDYLQRRVIQGVRDYGNRMGIPTANGSIHYHEDFRAKPTVIVGAYGILPDSRAEKGEPLVGDFVFIIGGRTGRDGIHGATFSSGEMTDRTANVNSSAVQIGNAIEEKRMFDALIEARDADLICAITDCGAAGLSSAIGEMGEATGVTVDISKAPLKYPGLAPWEIWISESQERMVAAIAPENAERFMQICAKYNVEVTNVGIFDGTHTLTVNYGEQNMIELDYDFLENGLPQREMIAKWQKPEISEEHPEEPQTADEWVKCFKKVLAHGNVCSKEDVVRQYDHGVQGGNVVSPYGGATQSGPNDALVIRPVPGKPHGIVQSHGMNPILIRLNPYHGTLWAIAEAAANYVAVGGDIDEAVSVGNYIWPSPDEESMGSLDMAVDAVVDATKAGLPPVISGKDSLSSTYTRRNEEGEVIETIKIPPVYAASIFGRIPNVEKTMTSDIKHAGNSSLYLIGTPSNAMGGSTYYDVAGGSSAVVPEVDLETLPSTLRAMHKLLQSGSVTACHDVSEGGVATTVAEMCFGGETGVELELSAAAKSDIELFHETAGCFVVEIPNSINPHRLKELADINVQYLGQTKTDTTISVQQYTDAGGKRKLFSADLDELKTAWQAPMKEAFHG